MVHGTKVTMLETRYMRNLAICGSLAPRGFSQGNPVNSYPLATLATQQLSTVKGGRW
jgi:hypothetical protein